MTIALLVLRFVNLLSAALIAGGQVLVLMVVLPVMRRWPPSLAVQTHQAMLIGTPDVYIVPSAIVCPMSAILILVLRHKADLSALFDVLGVVAAAGLTIASVAFAEPLSRRVLGWSGESVPESYIEIQQKWGRVHAVRTGTSLIMMAAFILATLTK